MEDRKLFVDTLDDILHEELRAHYPLAKIENYHIMIGGLKITFGIRNSIRRCIVKLDADLVSGKALYGKDQTIPWIEVAENPSRITNLTVNFINKSQDLADFLMSDEFGATARQKLLYSKPIQLVERAKTKVQRQFKRCWK